MRNPAGLSVRKFDVKKDVVFQQKKKRARI